jgi:acyl carrier protein phosphodiesterase
MNFLAHAFLSGDDEELLVGNFIADFVKGKSALDKFDEPIRKGIKVHRAIDAFTDSHPIVSHSKDRLREKYRHYAGVIVDVFYDHFLAKNWTSYNTTPLEIFASRVYQIVQAHQTILPGPVQNFLPFMIRGNWLVNYSQAEGIGRALSGMSRRTPYESRMDESVNELIQFHDEFDNDFREFFPQLQQHVSDVIEKQKDGAKTPDEI